jgi:hypothetical protein
LKYSVALIGLGKVAWQYDKTSTEISSLTHVAAINKHPSLEIVHVADTDPSLVSEFISASNASMFDSLASEKKSVDVVVIATSTESHLEALKASAYLNPKIVLIEKPVCLNMNSFREILEFSKNHDFVGFVNFQRFVDPSLVELSNRVKRGEFGEVEYIDCISSGTLMNSGPHMLNLIRMFLGSVLYTSNIKVLSTNTYLIQVSSLLIKYSVISTSNFVFKFDLYAKFAHISYDSTQKRVRITYSGKSEAYPNELNYLENTFEVRSTSEDFDVVYSELVHYLERGSTLLCGIEESYWEHSTLFQILEIVASNE